eukprot:Gb_40957 [translate_table: standard]
MAFSVVSDFDLFTLDDIDAAFQNVTRLTYSQNYHLSGKGEGIVITPYAAGHLLGGTVWKITKDGEDVIYAVDFNHRKERHLNGTLLESFVRPAVLITDAYNALNNQPSRRQRDQEFLDGGALTLDGKGDTNRTSERNMQTSHTESSMMRLQRSLDMPWIYTSSSITGVSIYNSGLVSAIDNGVILSFAPPLLLALVTASLFQSMRSFGLHFKHSHFIMLLCALSAKMFPFIALHNSLACIIIGHRGSVATFTLIWMDVPVAITTESSLSISFILPS